MRNSNTISRVLWSAAFSALLLAAGGGLWAQDEAPTVEERLQKLEQENIELRDMLDTTRSELERLRAAPDVEAEPEDTIEVDPDELDIDELLEAEPTAPDRVAAVGDPGMDTRQNPFISFTFDFMADLWDVQPEEYDSDGRHSERQLGLRTVEIMAQRGVSAYADGFVVLDYDGSIHLEEAYVDINRLVPRTNIRLGRWRTAFGPYNPVHEHQLPFGTFPRSVTNFFGDEGSISDGVEVSYLPRTDDFVELRAGGHLNIADEGPMLAEDQGSAFSPTAQVRYNRQLDDLTDLDFRIGWMNVPSAGLDSRTNLYNTAVQWRRDEGNMFSDRVILEWTHMDHDTGTETVKRDAFSAMYLKQLGMYHDWGLLYEDAEFGDPGIEGRVRNYNAWWTWKAQEEQWFRVLYRHGTYPTGPASNELIFQTLWSIGPHSHEFE